MFILLLAALAVLQVISIFQRSFLMSAIKDAADAIVSAVNDLVSAADAVLAAFQSGNPADIDAAIAELSAAKDAAVAESAKLVAAVPPAAKG